MKCSRFFSTITLNQRSDGFDNDHNRYGGHEETEGDVAGCFNAGLTCRKENERISNCRKVIDLSLARPHILLTAWEPAWIDSFNRTIAQDQGKVAT